MLNKATIEEDEGHDKPRPAASGANGRGPLSDDPVNKIMDKLGPAIVLITIMTFAFLGLLEAAGRGYIEAIIGPGFGLHGHGALVYVMSFFAYGCIGGVIGTIAALLVNAVLSIVMGFGPKASA